MYCKKNIAQYGEKRLKPGSVCGCEYKFLDVYQNPAKDTGVSTHHYRALHQSFFG